MVRVRGGGLYGWCGSRDGGGLGMVGVQGWWGSRDGGV